MKPDCWISICIAVMVSLFLLNTGHAVEEAQLVEMLISSDDGWTHPDEIKALSVGSIDLIIKVLETSKTSYKSERAINLVSRKYVQYEDNLTSAHRDNIVKAIVYSIDKNEEILSSPFVRDALIAMDHPRLYAMAEKYKNNENEVISKNAKKIISKYSFEHKAREITNASDPALRELEAPLKQEPAIEEPAQVAPVEVAEETAEQSSQWWLWLVGALVVVGGLGLAIRRKS